MNKQSNPLALAIMLAFSICFVSQTLFAQNFTGQGTLSNPYLISSADDLRLLANYVNNGKNYHDEYFQMTTNIAINQNVLLDNGELNPSHYGFEKWVPIGNSETRYFCGNFDGNGYSISGLYADDNSENTFQALFGFFSGTISNLTIYDSYFGGYSAAGMVGRVLSKSGYPPSIINSTSYVCVHAEHFAGGIVALSESAKLVIDKCVNYGMVTSEGGLGGAGMVGWSTAQYTRIKNCVNYGAIKGSTAPCGLISGNESKVYNSANFGSVNGNTIEAGICRSTYEINNCVNYGIIDDGKGYGIFLSIKDGREMDNTYFFSLSAKKGYDQINNINNLVNWSAGPHCHSMNASQMKDPAFLNQLNENARSLGEDFCFWIFGDDGFPTLEYVSQRVNSLGIRQIPNETIGKQIIHSVSGQHLTKLKKGVNIVNGRKVIIKL